MVYWSLEKGRGCLVEGLEGNDMWIEFLGLEGFVFVVKVRGTR